MPRLPHFLLLILALKTGAGGTALAQTGEVELKAVFVFTLTKYVDWPPENLPDGAPLRVCFAGKASPLADAMRQLSGRLVRGHPFEVRTGVEEAEQRTCHVLVNPPAGKNAPVPGLLLLSDRPGAIREGCHVELSIDDNRVHFDANLAAARQSGIQLSAQLLKLAHQVY